MASRTQHLSADARRAVTVQAVVALAAAGNPSAITTADIAGQMGVTQGALFRHFSNKEAVWQAVMEWVRDHLLARIDLAVDGLDSPLSALEALFLAHIDFVCEFPGVPRMIFGELQHPQPTPAKQVVRELLQQYRGRVQRLLEQARDHGQVPATLDHDSATALFIGTVQGLVMQSLLAGDVMHIRTTAPGAFALYLRGIRSPS